MVGGSSRGGIRIFPESGSFLTMNLFQIFDESVFVKRAGTLSDHGITGTAEGLFRIKGAGFEKKTDSLFHVIFCEESPVKSPCQFLQGLTGVSLF